MQCAGGETAVLLAGELLEAMVLRRLVPINQLSSGSVCQLLASVLHCQDPQDKLPVATGILWAVAQVHLGSAPDLAAKAQLGQRL